MSQDPYTMLGVTRDADAETIKKAYRRLARQLHPDVNPDPETQERFKEVSLAYEILSDPQKKAAYDENVRKGRCRSAQRDLQVLETQVPVYERNDRGEKVYLEDRERSAGFGGDGIGGAKDKTRDPCGGQHQALEIATPPHGSLTRAAHGVSRGASRVRPALDR